MDSLNSAVDVTRRADGGPAFNPRTSDGWGAWVRACGIGTFVILTIVASAGPLPWQEAVIIISSLLLCALFVFRLYGEWQYDPGCLPPCIVIAVFAMPSLVYHVSLWMWLREAVLRLLHVYLLTTFMNLLVVVDLVQGFARPRWNPEL